MTQCVTLNCTGERARPWNLCSYEEKSASHLSMQLGSGVRSCVTLFTLRKRNQEVTASVSHRSWKGPGGWGNDRDDLAFFSRIGS